MATVDEIIKDIVASVPGDVSPVAAAKWLNNRYIELVAMTQFRNLRKNAELSLEAPYETGTITLTESDETVTGSGTSWTSLGATDETDYFLQTDEGWFRISSITSDIELELASPYTGSTTSGTTYKIVRRYYDLASDCRWLGNFSLGDGITNIQVVSAAELDISYPGRLVVGSFPVAVAQVGTNSTGSIKVEIYPPTSDVDRLIYSYWSLPTSLSLGDSIPPQIDAYVLKEGTLVDVYRNAKIRQLEKGNIEAAGVYANEEAKQRTIWNKVKTDALRTQRSARDVSMSMGSNRRRGIEITNARDQIWYGGN